MSAPERHAKAAGSRDDASDSTVPARTTRCSMTTSSPTTNPAAVNAPPFTRESAILKVRAAEDAWNSRDPHRVSLAYTEDSVWRNRSEFLVGRDQIRQFLSGKWDRELDYRLVKNLWA